MSPPLLTWTITHSRPPPLQVNCFLCGIVLSWGAIFRSQSRHGGDTIRVKIAVAVAVVFECLTAGVNLIVSRYLFSTLRIFAVLDANRAGADPPLPADPRHSVHHRAREIAGPRQRRNLTHVCRRRHQPSFWSRGGGVGSVLLRGAVSRPCVVSSFASPHGTILNCWSDRTQCFHLNTGLCSSAVFLR